MKRFAYLILFNCIIILSACNKESYRHAVAIDYPSGGSVHFADETKDSVIFETFDSYEVKSQSDWLKTNYDYMHPAAKIANAYYVGCIITVGIDMEPNTTGKCRYGYVSVRSFDDYDWDQTASTVYFQYAWHNIIRPAGKYTLVDKIPESARFELKETAKCVTDSLLFTTYLDWELKVPQNSFVHPVKTNGTAGNQNIRLDFDENTSNKLDSVELKLVTKNTAIETPIWIYREGVKE